MKLGVNTVDNFSGDHIALNVRPDLNELSVVEHVKKLHQELGVDVVELPANMMVVSPHLFTGRTIAALAEYQESSGVGYSVHLPFRGLDVSSLCRPIAKASVASYKQIINQLEKSLNVEHYVMHLTETMLKQVVAKPHLEQETKSKVADLMYEQAKVGIKEIMEDVPHDKLLLENIKSGWQEPFSIAKELGISICCDIGHLLLDGLNVTEINEVIAKYRPLIRQFHFHDAVEWTLNDGRTVLQDHVALGTGILNVDEVLDGMLADFDGVLMIEVGRWEAAQESVRVVKEYLQNRN